MSKYFLIVFSLLLISKVWSQNTNLDFRFAVKIYNLTSFEEIIVTKKPNDSSSFHYDYIDRNLQILHPAMAVQWKTKKNNFHEIELTNFTLNQLEKETKVINDTNGIIQAVSAGDNLNTAYISVRYEYILNFNKLKDKKILLSSGFGFSPFYKYEKDIPSVSSSFPASEVNIGLRVFVTPRLTYFVSSRLFIDINIPLCVWDLDYIIDKDENPALTAAQQSAGSFNFQQFPKIFSGRAGVGLKF